MERAAKAMPQDARRAEQSAAPKAGDSSAALPKPGAAKPGEQKPAAQPGQGQPREQGQQGGQQGQQGQQGAQAANEAARAMEKAADQLAQARASQIDEWKSELTGELDQSIQEMLQLARQQEQLEQKLKQGTDPATMRGEQGALQQGVQKAGERLQQAGQKSSLLSPQSQRAAGEAQA